VYTWNWLPAIGTAGGILVGVKEDNFEVISWEIFKYCVSVTIKDRKMVVYGDLPLSMGHHMMNSN
jgi:hypothetical protein